MKSIKFIISLFLMFVLPITSFAMPPKKIARAPLHSNHHHGYYNHGHHHHSYYYSSNNYARDVFFTLLGLSAISAIVVAASKSSNKNREKEIIIAQQYDQVSQDLTLTQQQKDAVKKLFDTNREKLAQIRKEKNTKSIALEQEKAKSNPDTVVIGNLENDISQLSMNIFSITQDTKKELQTILTPEQYEAMEEMQL